MHKGRNSKIKSKNEQIKRQTERDVLSKRNTIIYVGVSITKIRPMKSAVLRKFP